MVNIIFDASVLASSYYKTSNRSGIFFVARNVLNGFVKQKNVKVNLYFSPKMSNPFDLFKIKNNYPNLQVIQNIPKCEFLKKVNSYFWNLFDKYHSHANIRKIFALGIIITNWYLRRILKRTNKNFTKCDVFFSPVYSIPNQIRAYQNISFFTILYDTIPFILGNYFNLEKESWFYDLTNSLNSKDNYFTISKSAKKDFCSLFNILNPNNLTVTYLAADSNYKHIEDSLLLNKIQNKYKLNKEKKYVFSLCTIEPRKNLIRAVRTFIEFINKNKINDLIWVMGGGQWDSFVEELEKQNIKWDTSLIIKAGYIDDEDLPVLYSNAEWFVYTSQYEGFGLPPLEAMQCGCPVITSNNSSLPEVVGDAGLMIDWDSDEQHIEAYEKYYFNKALRQENSLKGIERAKLFSWENTVDLMVEQMKKRI